MSNATHGQPATHLVGTCATCGLENVWLGTTWLRDGGTQHNCADQFACFAEWQRLKR